MHQAALLDGPALDALALQQNGLPPAEIDISRGQIVQALVVAPVVIPLDECLNIGLKRAWQVVVFQQDAVLHGLMPALDLALGLGMGGRAADMLVDLSRFCAAPLITYCAAKEMNHGHRQDG